MEEIQSVDIRIAKNGYIIVVHKSGYYEEYIIATLEKAMRKVSTILEDAETK